jgi:hypothetical protein
MMLRATRHYHAVIAAALTTACTTQVARAPCVTNADCAFADTPGCMAGVCAATGTGPPGCFTGQPQTTLDIANQCTTARTYPFDNCDRLHLCDLGATSAAFGETIAPPAPGPPMPPPVQPPPVVLCADVSPTPIYITGSPGLAPVIRAVQSDMSRAFPGYTAVFLPQSSCQGAAAILDPSPARHVIMNATNHWPFYYDATGTQTFCLLDPAGNTVDIGESDVDPSVCGYAPVPGVADYLGPIRSASFVVPAQSSEDAISAEAAHLMFAAGGDGARTTPWTTPADYFLGGAETVQLASPAIGAAPDDWWGIVEPPSATFATLMTSDPALVRSAIGLLSSDALASLGRDRLRTLAFQRRGQLAGFLPDSAPGVHDQANVRDGHYAIWSPMHFLTRGTTSLAVQAFVMQFVVPTPDAAMILALTDAGFIPTCAMQVRQTPDGPVPFTWPASCGCFYERQAAGSTTCHACTRSSDCPAGAPLCLYGYCEGPVCARSDECPSTAPVCNRGHCEVAVH